MKILLIVTGLIVAIPVLFLVTMYGASELGGEVVTLERSEASGGTSDVRLWIVDEGESAWIEHGDPQAHWISQLAADPDVTIVRDGRSATYQAAPDPANHARYHQLREAKYGWADQVVGWLGGGSSADCTGVPVRLEQNSGG